MAGITEKNTAHKCLNKEVRMDDQRKAYTIAHRSDKNNPAERETITTQRGSETHQTLLYQEMRNSGGETSERKRESRVTLHYLKKSKWNRHSSQHTQASHRPFISICTISEESGCSLQLYANIRQRRCVCACKERKNGMRKIQETQKVMQVCKNAFTLLCFHL